MQDDNKVTTSQNFEKLLEDYNVAKINYDCLPKNKPVPGVKFDTPAYKRSEAARVKMDLALSRVVMAKQELVKFLTVDKQGSMIIMEYNPFGEYLDKLEDMSYKYLEVQDKKTKAYTNASNDLIKWCIKVMDGNINNLFQYKLAKWFTNEKNVKHDCEGFCKEVAIIIRYYPHMDMKNNQDYMVAFFNWYNDLEEDVIMRADVLNGIMEELKKCFFPDKREKFEKEETLENEIYIHSPSLLIQDCSKKCHENFLKLRIGSEKKKSFLESILMKAQERKDIIEAKFAKSRNPPVNNAQQETKKRSRDEDGDEDNSSNKKQKLDVNDIELSVDDFN